MTAFQSIPSKLLLFGEHSILAGSPAFTIPLWDFSARLMFPPDDEKITGIQSNLHLKKFGQYLFQTEYFNQHFDFGRLNESANDALFLQSDIPQGYGLGSSASLCVALYKAFGTSNLQKPSELRNLYSQMESYFHGKSSGIDPLTIHTEKALIIKGSNIEFLSVNTAIFNDDIKIYLLDSRITRDSATMIDIFKKAMGIPEYKSKFQQNYLPLLKNIVLDISKGKPPEWDILVKLSQLQKVYFKEMIPDSIYKLWEKGLATHQYCLKILGAGGGGFFLVFAREEMEKLDEFEMRKIELRNK